ncbi:hypothetical protein BGZ60DRAFT_540482 [Tricladium varicosporioides]|nr:hypothetical protein BGZ60DRAFT_540482 [Hymenoscyphus varicosporioides]
MNRFGIIPSMSPLSTLGATPSPPTSPSFWSILPFNHLPTTAIQSTNMSEEAAVKILAGQLPADPVTSPAFGTLPAVALPDNRPKRRGRPPTKIKPDPNAVPKRRGRPPKPKPMVDPNAIPRRRGRPPKSYAAATPQAESIPFSSTPIAQRVTMSASREPTRRAITKQELTPGYNPHVVAAAPHHYSVAALAMNSPQLLVELSPVQKRKTSSDRFTSIINSNEDEDNEIPRTAREQRGEQEKVTEGSTPRKRVIKEGGENKNREVIEIPALKKFKVAEILSAIRAPATLISTRPREGRQSLALSTSSTPTPTTTPYRTHHITHIFRPTGRAIGSMREEPELVRTFANNHSKILVDRLQPGSSIPSSHAVGLEIPAKEGRYIYFAYGPEMDASYMNLHHPSARYHSLGKLSGHRWYINEHEKVKIEKYEGQDVWGYIYALSERDYSSLCAREKDSEYGVEVQQVEVTQFARDKSTGWFGTETEKDLVNLGVATVSTLVGIRRKSIEEGGIERKEDIYMPPTIEVPAPASTIYGRDGNFLLGPLRTGPPAVAVALGVLGAVDHFAWQRQSEIPRVKGKGGDGRAFNNLEVAAEMAFKVRVELEDGTTEWRSNAELHRSMNVAMMGVHEEGMDCRYVAGVLRHWVTVAEMTAGGWMYRD